MNNSLIYLETGSTNPFYNLAFEETVLSKRLEKDYLILWQNDNTVVVGQNQNTSAEIHQEFIDRHGIRVVRRSTGGGAVYHDLGNLNYSFITDIDHAENLVKERFTLPIVNALQGLGLDAQASGRNDILVSGHKVSGTAQRILGKRILHHGTLLFDSNLDMVQGALRPEPLKLASKGIQSVRSRVGNIREFLPTDMDLPAFWAYLRTALIGNRGMTGTLSAAELSAVKELQETKYSTWEWNYGKSPQYAFTCKEKWPGGILEIRLTVESGCIADIAMYGDFLSTTPLDHVENLLKGCRMERSAVTAALQEIHTPYYFGEITRDEVVETIFRAFD